MTIDEYILSHSDEEGALLSAVCYPGICRVGY